MSEDLIDLLFSDPDEYYPGSKRKRRAVATPTAKEKVDVAWDSRPYKKTLPNGKDIELFTVGALAAALGRPFVSVKLWNQKGYLPTPPYRLPTKPNKNGEEHKGRRLYSRAMVEKTVEIFNSSGLLGIARIEWANYHYVTVEIAEAWIAIKSTETQ